jgi:hypothetical protein
MSSSPGREHAEMAIEPHLVDPTRHKELNLPLSPPYILALDLHDAAARKDPLSRAGNAWLLACEASRDVLRALAL